METLIHTCSPGESWGWISLKFYADENLFPQLLKANPTLANIIFFEGGEKIQVPITTEQNLAEESYSVPPWRR